MHIALIGDSIFDNASYVEEGHSVYDFLSELVVDATVSLLALDGAVTTDVEKQLESLSSSVTHSFVSCGGNDALESASILDKSATSVGDAMDQIHEMTETFRDNYKSMLDSILLKNKNLTACTIYNQVPNFTCERKSRAFDFQRNHIGRGICCRA